VALSIDVGRALPLRQRHDGAFVLPGVRVTFGQLRQRSGVPEHALKRWTNAGVLEPTRDTRHSGSGNHRIYFDKEVLIAALLAPFSEAAVPLGRLLWLSRIFRHALRERRPGFIVDDLNRRYWGLGQAMLRAAQGVGSNFIAVTITSGDHVHFEVFTDMGNSFDAGKFLAEAGGQPLAMVMIVDMTDRLRDILS
jgi:hypothetical protein